MGTSTRWFSVLLLAGFCGFVPGWAEAPVGGRRAADLIVYGATASGVMTAYAAAREGLDVTLLEPGSHVGGMVTGGLSATDLGQFAVIGGYARDFYMEAAAHYGVHDLFRPANWYSEPHVDEAIFRKMLQDSGVDLELHFGRCNAVLFK